MKRTNFFTLFIAALIGLSCAGNKKINDMKEFINETTKCTEEFITQITASGSERDIVSTIESFNSSLALLEAKSKAMKQKYPDIDVWFGEPPAELAADLDRLHIAEKKLEDILKSDKVRELRKGSNVQSAFTGLINELERVKFFQD